MDNTNFIIDDFDGFGIKYAGSDISQWEKRDPSYRDENTTPTETGYGEMMEEPCPDVDDIGNFDKYISVTVKLDDGTNSGGNIATVKRCATNANRFEIGRVHNNPLTDTREYEVDLEDGTTDRYFANVIAENVYSRLNSKGHQTLVMIEIVDHQRDGSAVTK